MHISFRNALLLLLQCNFFHGASAIPFPDQYDPNNGTISNMGYSIRPRQTGKRSLRIMPLGASVTRGEGPPEPYNGYRKPLRDQLRFLGYPVNMIGCLADGDFNDNQHEGHRGALISQVKDAAPCSINEKPNLVLINVGSNDCAQANDAVLHPNKGEWLAGAYDRMLALLNYVYDNSDGVTIILSTLLPNGDALVDPNVKIVNGYYRRLVTDLIAQGRKIRLAEMDSGFIKAPADLAPNDPTHPNPGGYLKMAAMWADAIVKAESMIRDPINTGIPDTGTSKCKPASNQFNGPHQTQRGSGFDDGPYIHSQEFIQPAFASDVVFVATGGGNPSKNYHFAQLVTLGADRGGETDELIRVMDPKQRVVAGTGRTYPYMAYKQNGKWDQEWIEINPGHECLNEGVHWGDINNDGLDDFICLEPDMHVSINLGTNPPTFKYIGMIRAADPGTTKFNIRLGDIDGDGRIDYCAMDPTGSFGCWRNGGYGLAPTTEYAGYWQGIAQGGGGTFDGKGMPDTAGTRLVDINGDFRADWVYVYPDGHTRIFINNRGTKADGPGIKPVWTEAKAAHPAYTEGGKLAIDRDHFKFARIWGSGRADYVRLEESATNQGDVTSYAYHFYGQKNTGFGGQRLRGDGVRYCDMFGRNRDDYLWVFSTGEVYLYGNEGTLPDWKQYAQVLVTGRPRQSIHVGDWDGDGHCDILSVDRHTGQVDMWRNTWKPGQEGITFEYRANIARGCTEGWGVGLFDVGPRFADIDGDGRVDYLCMQKDGRTTGILNTATGLQDVGQVKGSQGLDRANHQFADVDGDGRADYLWVDKFTGDVKIWHNNGKIPSSGSAFQWELQADSTWMKGVDRGANMHFAKMSPSGKRNDFLQVLPATTAAYAWYNTCPGGSGGDDGPIIDPHLPSLPSIICPRAGEGCGGLNWVVMGDSYSAGPGAGSPFPSDEGSCYRTWGSYGAQLFLDFPETQGTFDFTACSGHTTQDFLDQQIFKLFNMPSPELVILTIGGNDALFGDIVKSCVLGFQLLTGKSCDQAIAAGKNVIGSATFQNQLFKVWNGIFDKLEITGNNFQVYHVLYPILFNQDDPWCNSQAFSNGPAPAPLAPVLSTDLRTKLNDFAILLNKYIMEYADNFSEGKLFTPAWGQKERLFTVDPNAKLDAASTWLGHRFCEPGITSLSDPSIYVIPWSGENYRRAKRQGGVGGEDTSKVFHPRRIGFMAIKNQLKQFIIDHRPLIDT